MKNTKKPALKSKKKPLKKLSYLDGEWCPIMGCTREVYTGEKYCSRHRPRTKKSPTKWPSRTNVLKRRAQDNADDLRLRLSDQRSAPYPEKENLSYEEFRRIYPHTSAEKKWNTPWRPPLDPVVKITPAELAADEKFAKTLEEKHIFEKLDAGLPPDAKIAVEEAREPLDTVEKDHQEWAVKQSQALVDAEISLELCAAAAAKQSLYRAVERSKGFAFKNDPSWWKNLPLETPKESEKAKPIRPSIRTQCPDCLEEQRSDGIPCHLISCSKAGQPYGVSSPECALCGGLCSLCSKEGKYTPKYCPHHYSHESEVKPLQKAADKSAVSALSTCCRYHKAGGKSTRCSFSVESTIEDAFKPSAKADENSWDKVVEDLADGFEEECDPYICRLMGLDFALLGVVERFGMAPVFLYDKTLIVQSYMDVGMTEEEGEEFFEYNVLGTWMGEGTPVFLTRGKVV